MDIFRRNKQTILFTINIECFLFITEIFFDSSFRKVAHLCNLSPKSSLSVLTVNLCGNSRIKSKRLGSFRRNDTQFAIELLQKHETEI